MWRGFACASCASAPGGLDPERLHNLVDPACSGNAGSKRWKPVARHARRSLTWPTASAPRRFGDERASPFSPHDVLEPGFVQGQVGDQLLRPLVLILELLEPSASRGGRRKVAGRS